MSVILNWFDDWRETEFECPGASCGWKGKIAPEQLDDHLQYGSFECPRCDACVALVQYPTAAEIKANREKFSAIEKRLYGCRWTPRSTPPPGVVRAAADLGVYASSSSGTLSCTATAAIARRPSACVHAGHPVASGLPTARSWSRECASWPRGFPCGRYFLSGC